MPYPTPPCPRQRDRLSIALLSAGLLCTSLLLAQPHADALTDGPYVIHAGSHSQALWLCDGALQSRQLGASREVAPACGDVPVLTLDASPVLAPDVLPAPARWAALSDIHGQAGLFMHLLRAHGITDEEDRWTWGSGVLVIAGDVFDRGPEQVEVLWALYRLGQEARAAGGHVELLLGNHEAMVLAGDLRYLHPRYLAVAEQLGRPYDRLFAADTELGHWLRHRATVLQVGDTLFLHGGLHPGITAQAWDLPALNAGFRARLGTPRSQLQHDPQGDWMFGREGPLWYRGYFMPDRASMAEVDAVLAHAGASRIVVGHTTQREIRSLYQGRVIAVDTALKNGAAGELLIHEHGALWRGLADGQRLPLAAGDDDGSAALDSL
jgi:hypothetical protein